MAFGGKHPSYRERPSAHAFGHFRYSRLSSNKRAWQKGELEDVMPDTGWKTGRTTGYVGVGFADISSRSGLHIFC